MNKTKGIVLSKKKLGELKKELEDLENNRRQEIADKLQQYRAEIIDEDEIAQSELLQEKDSIETRIEQLTEVLNTAKIVDDCENGNKVGIGCAVTVQKGKTKKEYKVVSSLEADPEKGLISEESPFGQALIGKKVKETVEVKTPLGSEKWKVVKVD